MVVLTSPEKAQAITHSGTMHADEVMATAILARAFGQNLRVARVPRVPENIRSDVIVYDIGYGRFDHHQCGGNGTRGNGIPYASAGLIWREFGPRITAGTADPEYVWKCVDRSVIAGIDAADCGETKWVQGPQPINLTTLISGFNLPWNCCGDLGKEFIKAVEYAGVALDHAIRFANSKALAKVEVEQALSESKDGIVVLDKCMPWREHLLLSDSPKANEALFVVRPSNREGWSVTCVPKFKGMFSPKRPLPEAWRGKRGAELRTISGIKTAIFAHHAGFCCAAETVEDAIQMAKQATVA